MVTLESILGYKSMAPMAEEAAKSTPKAKGDAVVQPAESAVDVIAERRLQLTKAFNSAVVQAVAKTAAIWAASECSFDQGNRRSCSCGQQPCKDVFRRSRRTRRT
eukprot:s329_g2.t1